ncbi:hypothetical protein HDU84_006119 [Entophlyctis sp. JEL0112]|nr:hypothetical protein HDU84_006119 [Entophlyctis sp. JEL0112]
MSFGDFDATKKAAHGLATQPFSPGDTTAHAQAQRPGERPIPLSRTPASSNPLSLAVTPSLSKGKGAATPPPASAASIASSVRSISPNSKINNIRKVWDRASNSVFQISNNVASMDALVSQLGSAKDTSELRNRLHELTESTRDMIKVTSADLKSLVISENSSNFEGRQHKMAQQKLQKDFESVLSRFQNVSKMAAKKSREYVQKARNYQQQKNSGDDGNDDADENAPLLNIQQQEQIARDHVIDLEVEYNENLIQEREQDLQNIERSIVEVNEIFRDLGTIVGEQQFVIDHIDGNLGSVAVHMEGATGELRIAAERQKAAQNRMCCLYTILGAVGMVTRIADYATSMAATADGLQVLVGCANGEICVVDTATLVVIATLTTAASAIGEIATTPARSAVYSASRNGSIFVHDIRSNSPVATIAGAGDEAPLVTVSANTSGNVLAAGAELAEKSGPEGEDVASLLMWDIRTTGKPLARFTDSHSDDITQIFLSNCRLVNVFKLSPSLDEEESLHQVFKADSINRLGFFGPRAEYAFAQTHIETFSLYSLDSGDVVKEFGDCRRRVAGGFPFGEPIEYLVDTVYDSDCGRLYLIAGRQDGNLVALNVGLEDMELVYTLHGGHTDIVRCVWWDMRRRVLASGGEDCSVGIWRND